MHFRATQALGNRIYRHIHRIRYGIPFVLHLEGDSRDSDASHRSSNVLSHRFSCGTVQRKQGPDSQAAQDHNTRRDELFPGYIHFASRAHIVSIARECKDLVIMLYLLPLSLRLA